MKKNKNIIGDNYRFGKKEGISTVLLDYFSRFDHDLFDNVKFDYYDVEFNHLDIKQKYPNAGYVRKPVTFDRMVEFAKIISKGYPHVRVDFYEVDGHLYFGEFTLYHFSGFMPFQPAEWDRKFGEWLKLPE